MSTRLHENGWSAAELQENGNPASYVGIGSAFTANGIHFIVVTKTADDLESVMDDLGWRGELSRDRFQPCKVSKS